MIGNDIMRETKEAFWRKKSYKLLSVSLIRFVETILISIVPSVISVFLILISQDPNGKAWKIFQFVSFLVFLCGNCYFFTRFSLTGRRKREIYLINGITYGIYMLITFIAYRYSDDVMFCSLTFATLRGFEGFGAKTITSIKLSHSIILVFMVACDLFARLYIHVKEKENMEEFLERMKNLEEAFDEPVVPLQNNREVKILSAEEMNEYMLREADEVKNIQETALVDMPDGVVEEGFTKGRGEEIIYADPDDLFDDDRIMPVDTGVNENEMYSGDALWNESVYQGRNSENKPMYVFDDEENVMFTNSGPTDEDDDFENEPMVIFDLDDEEEFYEHYDSYAKATEDIPYTSDELWEKKLYQGRDRNAVPERTEDFDDEISVLPYEEADDDEPVELWDNITRQGKAINSDFEELANEFDDDFGESPDADYDYQNLWDNITQGGKRVRDLVDEDSEAEINPYDDYDSDSLWSKDIHQGRKKE